MLPFRNIKFDDVSVGYDNVWTQICEGCRNKYNLSDDNEISIAYDEGNGICGVEGCENEADHYIDFK